MDKNVTVNLNGVDIAEALPKPMPPKSNFIRDYQVLLAGVLVASAIGFHAWWVCRVGKPITFNVPFSLHQHNPTEIKPVPMPITVNVPTPVPFPLTLPATKENPPPWSDRVVKEITPKK